MRRERRWWPSSAPRKNNGVAYVLTDYPKLAMTFISGELDQLEHRGVMVVPLAMNRPDADDVSTEEGRRRARSCKYLKAGGVVRVGATAAAAAFRHPVRMTSLLRFAARSAGLDLALAAKRIGYVVLAATATAHCRTMGVRHLHAHFAHPPASIAWFAAEIGNWEPDEEWTWSFTIHGYQDFIDERVVRLDLKAASAAFVVCVSDFTRSQLCRVTDPGYWDRFHVVRCGIALERFGFRAPPPLSGRPVVTTVARLSPEKGHVTLLHAVRELRSEAGLEVIVNVVGDGPSADALWRMARRLGVDDLVRFRGQITSDEVLEVLRSSDVFCLPSYSEGLPVSIMEAMALGVPVVATHIAGIPELAIDGETALTVAPANVAAMAAALRTIIEDRELASSLADNARKVVEDLHSDSSAADALASLMEPYGGVRPELVSLPRREGAADER